MLPYLRRRKRHRLRAARAERGSKELRKACEKRRQRGKKGGKSTGERRYSCITLLSSSGIWFAFPAAVNSRVRVHSLFNFCVQMRVGFANRNTVFGNGGAMIQECAAALPNQSAITG